MGVRFQTREKDKKQRGEERQGQLTIKRNGGESKKGLDHGGPTESSRKDKERGERLKHKKEGKRESKDGSGVVHSLNWRLGGFRKSGASEWKGSQQYTGKGSSGVGVERCLRRLI